MSDPDDDSDSIEQYLLDATLELEREVSEREEAVALLLRQIRVAAEREAKKVNPNFVAHDVDEN